MANPFNILNPTNTMNTNNMASIRNAYQMLTQTNNPMQVFQQMAMRNPQLQPVMSMLNQGMQPQQVFNTLCQQRGINPNEFLKSITGK